MHRTNDIPALLKASFLWDGIHEEPIPDGAILVEGGLIKGVGTFDQLLNASEGRILEFENATLLPAFVDSDNLAADASPESYLAQMNALCEKINLLSQLGIPSTQALQEATIVAARLRGIESQTGSLERGKCADIIVVDGNPIADISRLSAIQFVMKQGKILHPVAYRMLMEETFSSDY